MSMALAAAVMIVGGLFAFTRFQTERIERQFPPQGRFIDLEGGRIHVAERLPVGEPRITIVLLHGASGNQADIMTPLGDRLAAKGFRVIAPDRPGHGWSERIRGAAAASPAIQAKLIRAALAAMGVKRAIIVGHSFSGAIAVNFALDQPDFTRGLVLLAPVTHPWPGAIAWYNQAATTPVIGQVFTRLMALPIGLWEIDAAIAVVFAPQTAPPDYVARAGAYMILRPDEFAANAQDIAGLKTFVAAQAARMRAIVAPTAIVTGDRDGVVSTRSHSYASFHDIPGATLTILPGVGHAPHYAAPDRVVAAIEDVARRAGE